MRQGSRGVYSGDRGFGEALCRRVVASLVAVVLGMPLGACGLSFPMGSLFSDDIATGSIKPAPEAQAQPEPVAVVAAAPHVSPLSPDLSDEDLRRARSALAVALDPVGNGAAARWDNPVTKASGAFTPVGQPYVKADQICRAFTASVTTKEPRALQGYACRPSGGDWEFREIKPAAKA